jgi:hypothetical protein
MRRAWVGAAAGLLLAGAAAGLAVGRAFFALPEAQPPFPGAVRLSAQVEWDARGLHARRIYRTPVDVNTAAEWYRGGEPVPRLEANPNLVCADNLTVSPAPHLPVGAWLLMRVTRARYCAVAGGTEITTDTYYSWRHVSP